MRARMQRFVAVAIGVVAVSLLVAPAVAQARWTGSDYCAVQNDKGDWSLVGGGSCNENPAQSDNAQWNQALILDFEALTATNAYNPAEVETFDTLYAMLADLSENHASEGWMYVANSQGHSDRYVFLMVNRATCKSPTEWAIAPACDAPAPTPPAPTPTPAPAVPVAPLVTG